LINNEEKSIITKVLGGERWLELEERMKRKGFRI